MKQRTPINPMPESLDDTQINPNDVIGPNQAVNIPPSTPQALNTPSPEEPSTLRKRGEINDILATQLTEDALNKEILDEKIYQDIEASRQQADASIPKSPKDVLKALIAHGVYREDVELFGHTWTLRALDQGDLVEAFSDVRDDTVTTAGRVSSLVLSQIAYAIEKCDGISIYEWFSDILKRSDFNSAEEYKIAVRRTLRRYLERMANSVILKFDEAYTKIEKKRNDGIDALKKV